MLRERSRPTGAPACCCARWPRTCMLPTAAYVGGPAEIAYHAQIGPSYAHFGIPRPVLLPRPSVTLVEPAQARALEAEGLQPARPAGRPRGGARRAGRARRTPRWRRRSRARARRCEREHGGGRGGAWARWIPRCARAADGARGPRAAPDRDACTRSRRARSRSGTRRAPTGCAARATRCCPAARCRSAGLGLVGLLARHGPRRRRRARASAWTPGRAGHQVVYAVNIGITCYPTVGGSGAVAAELGKQLARRGHAVHFVSYRLPFRLDDFHENIALPRGRRLHLRLFEYPPHDLALAAKMAEVAREHQLDLLHVHYAIPHAIAGFLAQQMLGRQRAQARSRPCTAPTSRWWARTARSSRSRASASSSSDGVTAVSEFLQRMTVDEFEVDERHRGHPQLRRPRRSTAAAARLQGPLGLRAARTRRSCSTSRTSAP